MEARSPIEQQEVQLDEGVFIELEAEGQDSKYPDDAVESESPMKKKLEALQEKVKKQEKKTKKLKAKKQKVKGAGDQPKGSHTYRSQNTIADAH